MWGTNPPELERCCPRGDVQRLLSSYGGLLLREYCRFQERLFPHNPEGRKT